jgi:hypothetical protein
VPSDDVSGEILDEEPRHRDPPSLCDFGKPQSSPPLTWATRLRDVNPSPNQIDPRRLECYQLAPADAAVRQPEHDQSSRPDRIRERGDLLRTKVAFACLNLARQLNPDRRVARQPAVAHR